MLDYFTLILACQLVGELVATALDIPIPGPVVGMVLMFVFLVIKGTVPEQLGRVSSALLSNLSLLFVPAGVGVMAHFELLGTDIWPLSVAVVASTLLSVAVTALVMVFLNKRTSAGGISEGKS